MTNEDSNSNNINVNRIAEKHEYDIAKIDEFLNVIFPQLADDENILTWMSNSNIPSYPLSDDELLNKLKRVPLPKALYYSTATAVMHTDGKLYNRKALFKRFCVVVLDDIGTKIPKSKIPEDFKPTYIIESSEGNYQYGYVLETPIEILEQAEALIELVFSAGVTDAGGKMVNKLVRLPDGINGKKDKKKGKFPVRLVALNPDQLWTPENIIKSLDLDIQWSKIVEDANAINAIRAKRIGATAWSPIPSKGANMDGVVDPLFEWMIDNNMILQDTNEWMQIECPWGDLHTTGDNMAHYSPLGYGQDPYDHSRGFKCFHEHCRDKDTRAFIDVLVTQGAPQVPTYEPNIRLFRDYIYDSVDNAMWHVIPNGLGYGIPMVSAQHVFVDRLNIVNPVNGSVKNISEYEFFKTSPYKTVTHGLIYDPSTEDRVVYDEYGTARFNLFYQPNWGDGDYDMAVVQRFLDYIEYLIPDRKDSEFFLDWLAAKAQDMAFRGQAVLMVATTQGMGRTTLGNMIGVLFGQTNVENVPFEQITKEDQFNEWMSKPLIISDETLAIAADDNHHKIYERIKDKIDTTPKEVRINPKYGKQRRQTIYSSYLFFSNHTNALALAGNDRRFRVIFNADTPATPKYFSEINKMIFKTQHDSPEYFARHLWRWLKERKVKVEELVKPAELTTAKMEMINSNRSALDIAVYEILETWEHAIISLRDITDIVDSIWHQVDPHMHKQMRTRIVRKHFEDLTVRMFDGEQHKFKVRGATVRFRMLKKYAQNKEYIKAMTDRYSDDFDAVYDSYKEAVNSPSYMASFTESLIETLQYHDKI